MRLVALALAVLVLAGGGLVGACDSGHAAPVGSTVNGGNRDESTGRGGDCSSPGHAGCPCENENAVAECGQVASRSGDYVTCSMGHSRCDGKQWGECAGNRIVAASLPGLGLGLGGLHPLAVSGPCTDPCDPNQCTTVTGTTGDIGGSGVVVSDGGVSIAIAPPAGTACQGLFCQIAACTGAGATISGTVYDPAQKNPLYNATVYIPLDANAPLPAISSGATCDSCAGSSPAAVVAVAQTGPDGKFTLNNVPSGSNVPLIVQMGQWRRKVTLPSVQSCTDNPVDKQYTHLPRNRTDGDGNAADIPRMAIATGEADPFECMLLKAGIDPAEIDKPGSGARIEYYVMNGKDRDPGGAPGGTTLTSDLTKLLGYDAVILPCEGAENDDHDLDAPNLVSYANAGGRIFTTHFGYVWLATPNHRTAQNQTAFFGTADWSQLDTDDHGTSTLATIDQTFPKGAAFAEWLQNVGATTTLGQQTIQDPRHDARSAISPPSQRWMSGWSLGADHANPPDMLLAMTFNTPVDVPETQQCGRVVFSDFHVSAAARVDGPCVTNSDCGVGATCASATAGTCTDVACGTDTECPSGFTCIGAQNTGACTPDSCTNDSECGNFNCTSNHCECYRNSQCGSHQCGGACTPKACTSQANCGSDETCMGGVCAAKACTQNGDCSSNICFNGKCECISSLQCGGRACTGRECVPQACVNEAACGSSESCVGGVPGICQKVCDTNADCPTNNQCNNGLCTGCYADADCPGTTSTCTGGAVGGCTPKSMFPEECKQGNLSPQEAALEFMLFDLTSCVSPDSAPPPPPVVTLNPATFTLDFNAMCSDNQTLHWREVDWKAVIPDTASIVFSAQTGDVTADFDTAPTAAVGTATTSTVLPNWDVGVIPFESSSPLIPSKGILRLTVTLNPTTDQRSSPSLQQWRVLYDCNDST